METLGKYENNEKNYPKSLLEKRFTALFITIPQTTINYEELHHKLKNYNQINYILTKPEQHKDEGVHIHILLKFKQQTKIKKINEIIFQTEGIIKGTVDYQKPNDINASITYLHKAETSIEGKPYIEEGEIPKRRGRQPNDINEGILKAMNIASEGNTDEALEEIKQISPRDYLLYKDTIKNTLEGENKTRKKYTAPDMSKANVKLSEQQQKVWDLLQETPKQRRIIWVTGQYGSGKSFLYNYIKSNHDYGMYDAGQTASMDNLAYGYDEEGVIAWDLPRTFNFQDMGDAIGNVIEKFSDFGQSITSKKYNGKTQRVLGHAIVFSNHLPIEQLTHRNIIHIDLSYAQAHENKAVAIETKPPVSDNEEELIIEPVHSEINQPIYNPPVSDSEEEESPRVENTDNPNIQKVIKGVLHRYCVRYRVEPKGTVKSKIMLGTLEEAKLWLDKRIPAIDY